MFGLYKERGILLETLYPYTPQHNDAVERTHRHILEVARALRFQSSLPIEFRCDYVLTASYIIKNFCLNFLRKKNPQNTVGLMSHPRLVAEMLGCET